MKALSKEESAELLQTLKKRFEENMNRHEGLFWEAIQSKLERDPQKSWSLNEMERTGGEPDVVGFDSEADEYIFMDCSAESPAGRRSTCYDMEGLLSRKEHRPKNNAIDMAAAMGIELLTEGEYRQLQKLGDLMPRHRAGSKPQRISENWEAPSLAISASGPCSCITMAHNLTMRPEVSVACCVFKFATRDGQPY